MEKLALVSVYDKEGLLPFVSFLVEQGYKILSTGGTARHLEENGIEVLSVSEFTGSPEILDGRVKTLHPKVHGGILSRRTDADATDLSSVGGSVIDFVVVNLYPFVDQVNSVVEKADPNHDSLVEVIDIGGPTMIRAAAKNCEHVVTICDPTSYDGVMQEMKESGQVSSSTRRKLAAKVFATMSAYDGEVARYFALDEKLLDEDGKKIGLAPVESFVFEAEQTLRYGENPHQSAALYRRVNVAGGETTSPWEQLQGKEISYNNLLDMQGALGVFLELRGALENEHAAVVIKHSNPCGAAVRSTNLEAFEAARSCDPLSAFGGIIAVSGEVGGDLAASILEGFVEVVLAESYSEDAMACFKKKKNVRVLKCNFDEILSRDAADGKAIRNFAGDYLVQTVDSELKDFGLDDAVTARKPDGEMLKDVQFAWRICKHVKSNTIVVAKNRTAIGVGAGQMSRVDAARIAIDRAKAHDHDVEGAVAASDAFLPFPDTLEILNDAGIQALVQPGGSIKDDDVIGTADKRNVVMFFTGERHFRH